MDFEKLTIGQLKELQQLVAGGQPAQRFALPTGSNVVLRTVTMIIVGELVEAGPQELVLKDAAWVADTRRWADFLRDGALDDSVEVEPYPDGLVLVGRGALVDACAWGHGLLRQQR